MFSLPGRSAHLHQSIRSLTQKLSGGGALRHKRKRDAPPAVRCSDLDTTTQALVGMC